MANQIFEDIKFKLRSGNPITRLILINTAIFLLISFFRIISFLSGESGSVGAVEDLINRNLALPLSFAAFLHKPWTLFTYMFTQVGLLHLFWNMITLFWFGNILFEYCNPKKITPLYLLGGLFGGLMTVAVISFIPAFHPYTGAVLIGASAGVTAIIVAAATLIPNFKMNLMFIGPVKLVYVALFVIFIDVLDVASYSNVGGNLAHLGGALMGFIFMTQYKKGRDWAKPVSYVLDNVSGIFKTGNRTKMKVVHKRTVSDEEYNYSLKENQQMIDDILDKISRSGYESLTKKEKEILFKASKK